MLLTIPRHPLQIPGHATGFEVLGLRDPRLPQQRTVLQKVPGIGSQIGRPGMDDPAFEIDQVRGVRGELGEQHEAGSDSGLVSDEATRLHQGGTNPGWWPTLRFVAVRSNAALIAGSGADIARHGRCFVFGTTCEIET
jgi:hypothetical protein